jgi:hypothetical protein
VSSVGTAAVAAGDFDGDGNQDFAVLYRLGNQTSTSNPYVFTNGAAVFVYYGNGDGTFSAPVTAGIFVHHYSMITATDLNGDGRSDLILRADDVPYDNPSLSILHAGPGRTFTSEVNYTAGTGLTEIAALDVNRDGLPDLLVANGGASSVTVLLNLGNTPVVSGALIALPEPSTIGQHFSLYAGLVPPSPATLTGNVEFYIDGADVGSAPLSANVATFPVSTSLSIGTHIVTATWLGDSTYAPVTLSATHRVTGFPVTLSLTALPNPAAVGQLVTITQSIASTNGSDPTPTGTFTLSDNGVIISSGNALNWTLTRGFAPGGNHTLTLSYSGDANHNPASASTVLIITPVASTIKLGSSANPSSYGQSVTFTASISDDLGIEYHQILASGTVTLSGFPTGPVTIPVPSTILGNTNAVTYTTNTIPVGSYPITATYSGNASLDPSTSTAFTQIVTPGATVTTLAAAPNPAYQTQTVTLSAQVSGALAAPTGTIQFLDGGAPLASATAANGQATFATAGLAPGTHILTASYSGDTNNNPSTSPAITETILPSTFIVSITPTSISLVTGHHTTLKVTAASVGAFADTITFSSASVPLYTSTIFTPTTVHLTPGSTSTSILYLDTDAVIGYLSQGKSAQPDISRTAVAFALAPFALLLSFAFRRRGNVTALIAAVIAFTVLFTATGCSGKYPSSTTPGTYQIQIIGTAQAAHTTSTANLTLVVTP